MMTGDEESHPVGSWGRVSACSAAAGPGPTRSLPALRPPLPARPCSAQRTHRELRTLPEGGRRPSADREAREETRRTPNPSGTPPAANFQTLGAAERASMHLAP